MEKERLLEEIRSNIRSGRNELAVSQINELAQMHSSEPFTLLTCASLMKVIGDKEQVGSIVDMVTAQEAVGKKGLEVAKGLRGIGCPGPAFSILSGLEQDDEVKREKIKALVDMGSYVESIEADSEISQRTIDDDIRLSEILGIAGRKRESMKLAEEVIKEAPGVFEAQRCYCSALIASGRGKEAERFAKDMVKADRSSPDNNALMAHVLWLEGKSTSAGAYAARAVKADSGHIGAMEILAYCLVEKGKTSEARIVAGAINERSPGHAAVVRILDVCNRDQ